MRIFLMMCVLVLAGCQSQEAGLYNQAAMEALRYPASVPQTVVTLDQAMLGHHPAGTVARAGTPVAEGGSSGPTGLYAALAGQDGPKAAMPAPSQTNTPIPTNGPQISAPAIGALSAIHIASFRSADAARQGWETIAAQGHQALSGLSPRVERVHLGPERGVYHRLKLGPVPNEADAERRCETLKASGLFCTPTSFDGNPL
jgi:cell division septation protein DedD